MVKGRDVTIVAAIILGLFALAALPQYCRGPDMNLTDPGRKETRFKGKRDTLKASTRFAMFGIPLPEGAELLSAEPQTESVDAREEYRISASNKDVIAFFDEYLIASGWEPWGYLGNADFRSYQKPGFMIGIIAHSGGFTVRGGTR